MVSQDELENLVPSSTISTVGKTQTVGSQTQVHARALRGLLESLDDVRFTRGELVSRAQRRGEVDDIKSRIVAAAARLDRDTEITPAMFTDVSDEELAKYDRFIQGLVEGQKKQEGLLEAIKVRLVALHPSQVSHYPLVHKREILVFPKRGHLCQRAPTGIAES